MWSFRSTVREWMAELDLWNFVRKLLVYEDNSLYLPLFIRSQGPRIVCHHLLVIISMSKWLANCELGFALTFCCLKKYHLIEVRHSALIKIICGYNKWKYVWIWQMFAYNSSLCGGFRLSKSSSSPSTASSYGLDDETVKQDCNRDFATPMTIDSVCLSASPPPSVVLPLLEAKYVVVWSHNQSKESMMILPNHNLVLS